MLYIGRREWFEVFAERPPRNVREGWRQRHALNPVVAFGAQIELPVARKLRGIQDASLRIIFRRGSMLHFSPGMVCAGTVTAFA
jgi:hypothetical protein